MKIDSVLCCLLSIQGLQDKENAFETFNMVGSLWKRNAKHTTRENQTMNTYYNTVTHNSVTENKHFQKIKNQVILNYVIIFCEITSSSICEHKFCFILPGLDTNYLVKYSLKGIY